MKIINGLNYQRIIILIILFCASIFSIKAQLPLPISEKAPYYIDVNKAEKPDVYEIQEGLLNLQYDDKFGQWKEIPLHVYNWKKERVGNFNLDKTFGLNNYRIDLNTQMELDIDEMYFCMVMDEAGNRYEWSFREIAPVRSNDLTVDIVINPLQISCSDRYGNLVEFYGSVQNGRAPYVIQWFVINEGKTDFLYQPKEDKIMEQGKTSVIQVDKSPAYHVMMDVTDACGTNAKKMVFLECKDSKKKINTVFVEPVNLINTALRPSN